MKAGLTLVEMAQTIQAQASQKRDYVADTRQLAMQDDGSLALAVESNTEVFSVTPHTHGQIAARLQVPKRYYDRLLTQAPELLAKNVNHWFQENPEPRMIRTLDSTARAFLSNRYRRVDHYEIAETVFPVLSEYGDALKIASIGLTDKKLYIKVVNQRMEANVKVGDPVQAGVVISNSEIGAGSISIEPLVYRLVCSNGLTVPDRGMKKYHAGRGFEADSDAYELLADDTRKAEDKALLLKIRDLVRAATSEALFAQIVNEMRATTERPIEGNPVRSVEVLSDKFALSDDEQSGVLTHLIQGGDLSQYGLLNAVTRTAQDLEDYDRATEFEVLGSQVMKLPARDWKELATAR